MVNGNSPPKRIKLGRGCRQGDPIAGYLFILCIEILLLKVANNQHIKPWTSAMGNKQICDGYADDLNIYLKMEGIELQITQLLKIFKEFREISGLKININKTKYVLFGTNGINSSKSKNGTNPRKNKKTHTALNRTNPNMHSYTSQEASTNGTNPKLNIPIDPEEEQHFKLLGIYLNADLEELEHNWLKALSSARKEAFRWAPIRTTYFGRANIAKTCLIAKFTHIAAVIPPPKPNLMKKIEKFFTTFINGSKRATIPKDIIFSSKENGGLGLPNLRDFFNSMGMTWFRRTSSSNSFWLTLLNERTRVHPALISSLSEFTLERETQCTNKNLFWTNLLERWKTMNRAQLRKK